MYLQKSWVVNIIRASDPPTRCFGAQYIITTTKLFDTMDEDVLTIHSSDEIYMRLIFEHIVTRFGCPWSFTNDQGKHFIAFTREFMIHHHKTMLYHPQNNGMAEAFSHST